MKVAYLTGPQRLEIAAKDEPRLDEPGQVRVRIDRVGICGSDVHYYVHGGIGAQRVAYPATVGHECAGTIVELGAGVTSLKVGQRVAIDPALACGRCDQCQAGRVNTCRNLRFMGCPGQADGAAAEYHVLPAENCLPIPDSMSLDEAVLAEPLSIGLHATRLGEVYPAARVAIFGAGPIGLSVLLCAKATAPCTVHVTDRLGERLELARRFGADWTGSADEPGVLAELARREPWGFDLVFECSGDPNCIDAATEVLAPGGTLVIVGIPTPPAVAFDPHRMRTKELVFKAVRRQRGCMVPVLRMIAQRAVDPRPMITHRFPLERMEEGFRLVAAYADGVVKAMVDLTGAE